VGGKISPSLVSEGNPHGVRRHRWLLVGRRYTRERSLGMWVEYVKERRNAMSSIFYIIGVVVVILIVLSFFGLR
jgi:hypothetical protein